MISQQLISSIDFGPTVLNLAGVDVPGHIQGRPFLGPNAATTRDYVFGARDRMDERYDIIAWPEISVLSTFVTRAAQNLLPIHEYARKRGNHGRTEALHQSRALPREVEYYFSPTKPVEELYDTWTDPYEVENLVGDPVYADTLSRLREAHLSWVKRTRDTGLIAEPILIEREKTIGHRYGILRQNDDPSFHRRLADIAAQASGGLRALQVCSKR